MRYLSGPILSFCVRLISLLLNEPGHVVAESSFLGWRRRSFKPISSTLPNIRSPSGFGNGNLLTRQRKNVILLRGGNSCSDSEDENEEEEYISLVEEDDDRIELEDENVNVAANIDGDGISSFSSSEDVEEDEEGIEEEYETFPLSVPDTHGELQETHIETNPNAILEEESNDTFNNHNHSTGTNIAEDEEEDVASNNRSQIKKSRKENRRTSDIILELDRRSSVFGNEESLALRQMITTRTSEYVYELQEEASHYLEQTEGGANVNLKLMHPRKLLHSLAKKVPAIKQSPDVNLRIHSSRADIDPGVAACLIGRLAFACEQYEQVQMRLTNEYCDNTNYEDENSDPADGDAKKNQEQIRFGRSPTNNGSSIRTAGGVCYFWREYQKA